MKRNLLVNSLLIAFGIVFAISAQEKKQVERTYKVYISDGTRKIDTAVWEQKIEEMAVMKDSLKHMVFIKSGNDGGENISIEEIINKNGDTTRIKTIVIDYGNKRHKVSNFDAPPPPPPPSHIKIMRHKENALEALLKDPSYEILEFDKKEKNGVEKIEITRKKKK